MQENMGICGPNKTLIHNDKVDIYDINNQACISGRVVSGFRYSHTLNLPFDMMYIESTRKSGIADIIPVRVPKWMMPVDMKSNGEELLINGRFRSFNYHTGNKTRVILYLLADQISLKEKMHCGEQEEKTDKNNIILNGYICKRPVFRVTPMGREISDLILAINNPDGTSDYIPCIAWEGNAEYASELDVGTFCKTKGRIQSREYGQAEKNIAFEVSLNEIRGEFY